MPTVLAPADLIVTKCQIILTVPGADADSAGENALVALGEFLSELDKEKLLAFGEGVAIMAESRRAEQPSQHQPSA